MKAILKSNKRDWRAALGILCWLLLMPSLHAGLRPGIAKKISPALEEEVEFLSTHPHYDYPIPVIVQFDEDFFARRQAYRRRGNRNTLRRVKGQRARLNESQIRELLESPAVRYITVDAPIRPTADTSTTGNIDGLELDILRRIVGADLTSANGEGITIALFDSGITGHQDLVAEKRIKVAVDFTTGEPVFLPVGGSNDEYGHGTHVAGIIGGRGGSSGHDAPEKPGSEPAPGEADPAPLGHQDDASVPLGAG